MRVVVENKTKSNLKVRAELVLEAKEVVTAKLDARLLWHIKELVFTISGEGE